MRSRRAYLLAQALLATYMRHHTLAITPQLHVYAMAEIASLVIGHTYFQMPAGIAIDHIIITRLPCLHDIILIIITIIIVVYLFVHCWLYVYYNRAIACDMEHTMVEGEEKFMLAIPTFRSFSFM